VLNSGLLTVTYFGERSTDPLDLPGCMFNRELSSGSLQGAPRTPHDAFCRGAQNLKLNYTGHWSIREQLSKCCRPFQSTDVAYVLNFVVQRTPLRLAEKSFSVAGPRAWNSLPSHSRTLVSRDLFSRHLKTNFSSFPMTFSDLFLFTLLR